MKDVYIVTMSDGSVHHVVHEEDYFKTLLAIKSLVEDQRKALRSHDKDLIIQCKMRERKLIEYVKEYETWRAGIVELKKVR